MNATAINATTTNATTTNAHAANSSLATGVLVVGQSKALAPLQITAVELIAGADEAGRGPLIGSVVAAAVILDPNNPIVGLDDSKKLSEKKRNALYQEIVDKALCYCIAEASHSEIDSINILNASMLAMQRALENLPIAPQRALIDGNKVPNTSISCQAVVGGDALHACISAASILAKVARDQQLLELDAQYPMYGFASHKGYPTAKHMAAIAQYGVLDLHRRSYAPIKKFLGL